MYEKLAYDISNMTMIKLHGMPGYATTPEQRAQLELMKNTEY